MRALVIHADYAGGVRLLAVYLNGIALERRFNFEPIEIGKEIDEIKTTLLDEPLFTAKISEVSFPENIKPNALGAYLRKIIEESDDEKALLALAKLAKQNG